MMSTQIIIRMSERIKKMSSVTQLSFSVESFRNLTNPFVTEGKKNAIAVVNVLNLPDLSGWRTVNVRDVKKTGRVPKAIRESLLEKPDFLFMNRGLVLTVKDWDFDNQTNELSLYLAEPQNHGLLD